MFGTQLGLGQSSVRFGSGSLLGSRIVSRLDTGLLGSTWLEARLVFARGPAQPEARSLQPRAWVTSTPFGLARLDSARQVATRCSAHLGSWLRLGLRLRLWARKSTRCSVRLSSEIDSALATQDSSWLRSGLSSAHLDRSPAQLISARFILAHKFLYIVCGLLHRRKSAIQKQQE